MHPLAIIKHLDKLKHLTPGLVASLERAVMHQLVFQRAEEALRDHIIVAVPAPIHAGDHAMLGQHLPIGRRRILAVLIRVMDHAWLRLAVAQRHRERVRGEGPTARGRMAQPTTRREYRSRTAARESQPARVGIAVMSPTHTRLGRATAKCCYTRVGAGGGI